MIKSPAEPFSDVNPLPVMRAWGVCRAEKIVYLETFTMAAKATLTMRRSLLELPPEAKCTRCRNAAAIRMPSHHANFCPECFIKFFETGVLRAMKKARIDGRIPIMVAVSGGKDSLSTWGVLQDLGYETKGLHMNLGIDGFSEASAEAVRLFAEKRGLEFVEHSLEESFGYTLAAIRHRTRRKICSVCGFLKRQLLNRLTIREGFRLLAVGHNLDDEAGRLLGNLVRHRSQYARKQCHYLPSTHPGLPAKVKPLYRLEAYEVLIYCSLKGIAPLEMKCPLSRGATSHTFKEALDFLEDKMPGTKRHFLFSYLRQRPSQGEEPPPATCMQCGEPAYEDLCSVCNLANQLRRKQEAHDIEMRER